jgi:hypothetical protein
MRSPNAIDASSCSWSPGNHDKVGLGAWIAYIDRIRPARRSQRVEAGHPGWKDWQEVGGEGFRVRVWMDAAASEEWRGEKRRTERERRGDERETLTGNFPFPLKTWKMDYFCFFTSSSLSRVVPLRQYEMNVFFLILHLMFGSWDWSNITLYPK